MDTVGEEIVEEFVATGWKSNPFDKLLPLLKEQREQALPLAMLIIERVPKGGTFFDLLLSHLTEDEFRQLIDAAVDRLRAGQSDVLDSIIAYGALQFPSLLSSHLEAIFDLQPNSGTYYEEWPWRGADAKEIARLQGIVSAECSPELRMRAWRCLVETRQPQCIEFAAQTFPPDLDRGAGFDAYAHLAGFDPQTNPPRRLHTDCAHHIVFPSDYFSGLDRPAWLAHSNHPTWSLDAPTTTKAEFGGVSDARCGSCGSGLHRLIRFRDADKILGIRLSQIELSTCLSCLGWEQPELFFCHDDSGIASPFSSASTPNQPEFPAEPLRAATISLKLSPPRWQFQDWALSNSRENLNRIGGAPSWIQDSQYPKCPSCRELMSFIMQLDSDLPTHDGGEWLWGSGGIAYFFWCDDCAISASLWQCT